MRISPKTLTICMSLVAILISCSPVAQSQTFRERLRERAALRGGGLRGGAGILRSDKNVSIPPGVKEVQISVNGQNRSFLYYLPSSHTAHPGMVLALHGGRGSGAKFIGQTPSLLTNADRRGFIAVYPTADGNWNDGRSNFANKPSDIPFMRAIVDWLATNVGADRSRVFALGASNGGAMTYKLACDAADLVAGIAPIISSMTTTLHANCRPSGPTPVVMFNGTADPLSVYEGGKSTSRLAASSAQEDTSIGVEATAAFWAQVDGCSSATSSSNLPDRYNDGTSVTLVRYSCPRDQVWSYRVIGAGHTIPGMPDVGPITERLVGKASKEIDAVSQAVVFFQKYGL